MYTFHHFPMSSPKSYYRARWMHVISIERAPYDQQVNIAVSFSMYPDSLSYSRQKQTKKQNISVKEHFDSFPFCFHSKNKQLTEKSTLAHTIITIKTIVDNENCVARVETLTLDKYSLHFVQMTHYFVSLSHARTHN